MLKAKGENVLIQLFEKETIIGHIIIPDSQTANWKQRNGRILSVDENNPVIKELELEKGQVVRLPELQILYDTFLGEEISYIKARSVMFIVPEEDLPKDPQKIIPRASKESANLIWGRPGGIY